MTNFELNKVLEHTHQFQEVQDLIFRFETLDKNLNELIQLDQDNDEIYKKKLKELNQFKEVKGFLDETFTFGNKFFSTPKKKTFTPKKGCFLPPNILN